MPWTTRVFPLLSLLVACGGPVKLTGDVGGQPIEKPRSAVYNYATFELPGEEPVLAITAVLSDAREGCDVMSAFSPEFAGETCEAACERLGYMANEYLGDDSFYTLTLSTVVDPASPEGAQSVGTDTGQFGASFAQWDMSGLYDSAACAQACSADVAPLTAEVRPVTGGELDITLYDGVDDALEGELDISMDGGALQGEFKAERCETLGRP